MDGLLGLCSIVLSTAVGLGISVTALRFIMDLAIRR